MTTKLNPWTFNAKKWREENGYTTSEWQMYVNNVIYTTVIFCVISYIVGVIVGKVI